MPPRYGFTAKTILEEGRVPKSTFEKLKEWCSKEERLPQLSDEQLVLFLLSCFNEIEATKKTIYAHFKCKFEAPELFSNRSVHAEDVQKAMKVGQVPAFPARTTQNDAIMLWRLQDFSYSKLNVEQQIKLIFMVGELLLQQNPPDGLVVLIDLKGLGLLHVTRLRVGPLRKFFRFVQEGYSCKIKQIHVLNTVYFIDKIMIIMRPLMSKALYEMIKFHPTNMDMNEFYAKYLPVGCLPEDYGGVLPDVATLTAQTYNVFQGLRQFYIDEEEQVKEFKPK